MSLTDDLVYLWAVWDGFGVTAATRHGFAMAGSSPALKQMLMQDWATNSLVILLPMMSSNYNLVRLYCEDVAPGTAPPQEWVGALTQVGLSTGEAMPGQVAVITTWKSDLAGRANRGRTYWPGVGVVAFEDGLLGPAGNLAFNAYAADLMARWGPEAILPYARLGTISRQLDGVPRGPLLIETTHRTVHPSPAMQKRRRSRFGA